MKKRMFAMVIFCLVSVSFSCPAFAGWVNDVISYKNNPTIAKRIFIDNYRKVSIKDADKLRAAGFYEIAISAYEGVGNDEAISKKTRAKAFFNAGVMYVERNDTRATVDFINAVVNHPRRYDKEITQLLNEAVERTSFERYFTAIAFHEALVKHDPRLRSKSPDFYMRLGDFLLMQGKNQYCNNFEKYYKAALHHAQGKKREEIGRTILLKGKNGQIDLSTAKSIVKNFMPDKWVEGFFSQTLTKIIFRAKYSDIHANEKGEIIIVDFSKFNVKSGDVLKISGKVPPHAGELHIAKNKKWVKISKGKIYREKIKYDYKKGKAGVWIDKGNSIVVNVWIERDIEISPKYPLLATN